MNKQQIIDKLRDDKHYYGEFGQKYLSNSNIGTLLSNPLALGNAQAPNPAFLVGSYFHTAILEPDKLKKYKIIQTATRNNKVYKDMSDGELCLLQHEVDIIEVMTDKMITNDICRGFIRNPENDYEVPGIGEIEGRMWKGKADIINYDEKLIIDLKTTNDINSFKYSANKYNYDSQAYIYRKIFGMDILFIVIDKNTYQIGIFDCSDDFYSRGHDKVKRAVEAYELFFDSEDFDSDQFFITKTL